MDGTLLFELADQNEMAGLDKLIHLSWAATATLWAGTPGDFVEVGCNAGRSSVLFQSLLLEHGPGRTLHVYDSFAGLPAPGPLDAFDRMPMLSRDGRDRFGVKGRLSASKTEFIDTFRRFDVPLPEVHEGWFDETLPLSLPDEIAFAYLDSDLYESIITSLEHVYPRLAGGAVCVIDDYADRSRVPFAWNGFPAVKAACDAFFTDKPERIHVAAGRHGGPDERRWALACGWFRKA